MKRVCVFCGSSFGVRPDYARAARALASAIAGRGMGLVYGGGRVGLMGELARAMLEAGGRVTGVIPRHIAERGVAFSELADLRIVETMHERKALMAELADGFVALPGGLGTLEEFLEALTWAQLGVHRKPCGLLSIGGYYAGLLDFLEHAVEEGFLNPLHRATLIVEECPERLLDQMGRYAPPDIDKAEWALRMARPPEA